MGLILTKVSTPSSPSTNTLDLFYETTLSKLCAIDQSGNVAQLAGFSTKDYRLTRILFYTGNASYTPTAGTKAIYVECWGGGGAGGGAASSTAGTNNSVAGGGGGGAYAASWITGSLLPPTGTLYNVTIGAGGAAATAGNNAGGNGSDTTFVEATGSTTKVSARAGNGGAGGGVAAITLGIRGAGGIGGAAVSSIGDVRIDGGGGDPGVVFSVAAATGMLSGRGGHCPMGAIGGASLIASGVSPNAGGSSLLGWGSGSAGSCDAASTNRSSGLGGYGACRLWEFA